MTRISPIFSVDDNSDRSVTHHEKRSEGLTIILLAPMRRGISTAIIHGTSCDKKFSQHSIGYPISVLYTIKVTSNKNELKKEKD